MACGQQDTHCCYVAGQPCAWLRDDGADWRERGLERRYVCTLMERHGGDPVRTRADPDYQAVQTQWPEHVAWDCISYPTHPCSICGEPGTIARRKGA